VAKKGQTNCKYYQPIKQASKKVHVPALMHNPTQQPSKTAVNRRLPQLKLLFGFKKSLQH